MTATKTFKLALTKSHRDAIDWVGHRYSHGNDLSHFLDSIYNTGDYENDPWHLPTELEIDLPEARMEEYERLITEDDMACFSEELKHTLQTPLHHYLSGR